MESTPAHKTHCEWCSRRWAAWWPWCISVEVAGGTWPRIATSVVRGEELCSIWHLPGRSVPNHWSGCLGLEQAIIKTWKNCLWFSDTNWVSIISILSNNQLPRAKHPKFQGSGHQTALTSEAIHKSWVLRLSYLCLTWLWVWGITQAPLISD